MFPKVFKLILSRYKCEKNCATPLDPIYPTVPHPTITVHLLQPCFKEGYTPTSHLRRFSTKNYGTLQFFFSIFFRTTVKISLCSEINSGIAILEKDCIYTTYTYMKYSEKERDAKMVPLMQRQAAKKS